MAYENGNASSYDDFIDKVKDFLLSAGWFQEYWGEEGTGFRLHMYKSIRKDFNKSTDSWVESSTQTVSGHTIYYAEDLPGNVISTSKIFIDSVQQDEVDSVADIDSSGHYAWDDVDSIGNSTVYIVVDDSIVLNEEDPDYIEYGNNMYVNFRSTDGESVGGVAQTQHGLYFNLSKGFDESKNWYEQPGYINRTQAGDPSNPCICGIEGPMDPVYSYHFFETDEDVLIVAELLPSIYRAIAFGKMIESTVEDMDLWYMSGQVGHDCNYQTGNTSGHYQRPLFCASDDGWTDNGVRTAIKNLNDDRVYYNINGDQNTLIAPMPEDGDAISSSISSGGFLQRFFSLPTETYRTTALLPLYFAGRHPEEDNFTSLGYIANMRSVIFRNQFLNADEIVLGEDTWMVFNLDYMRWKNGSIYSSPKNDIGIAIKKTE